MQSFNIVKENEIEELRAMLSRKNVFAAEQYLDNFEIDDVINISGELYKSEDYE